MSLTGKQTTAVTASGVGRKDYSQDVQYSVETQLRSLQERFFFSYHFTTLGALVFPNVYESPLQFLVGNGLQFEAPSTNPWMFYLAEATTDTVNLAVVALNRYASYQDFLNGIIAENGGTMLGFLEAKLDFTKGIPTIAGSVYSIQYGVYSGAPFNLDLVVHGLIGGQEDL